MTWENRIVGSGVLDPKEITPNPSNWRRHTVEQRATLDGVLGQVGWVQQVIVNQRTGRLVDGHLRVEEAVAAGESGVPVVYVDLSDDEEALILATFDPISAMAEQDAAILAELLDRVHAENGGVQVILDSLRRDAELVTGIPNGRRETARVADLRPHPQNYRTHPEDQIEHISESIREHGIYRNILVARDGTILAGHGVIAAVKAMGREVVPIVRMDLDADEPRALKLLAADNEIGHLGDINDRARTELLKSVAELDPMGLLGTGFDERMLANLLYVTRPINEIQDLDEAAHWAGLPEYGGGAVVIQVIITFRNEQDRNEALHRLDLTEKNLGRGGKATWWPPRENEDATALLFEQDTDG